LELVATIAVVSLLLALIVPAIQSARETASRTQCLSNLRQLTEATDAFQAAQGHLPPTGFVELPASTAQQNPPGVISPWGQLLPYFDAGPLHARLDYSETGSGAYPTPGSAVNAELLDQHVPVLVCPSDLTETGATNYRVCQGTAPGASNPAGRSRGAYFSAGGRTWRATWARVIDGLSQTALISEKIVGDQNDTRFFPPGDTAFVSGVDFYEPDVVAAACAMAPFDDASPHASFGGATWLLNGYLYTWYNHILTPNSHSVDCSDANPSLAQAAATARSWHPGGVNVAMADGSARLVGEEIDLTVWRALATRDGRETVSHW
jgi:prepilin-type processing-associated H-X9-DG protein